MHELLVIWTATRINDDITLACMQHSLCVIVHFMAWHTHSHTPDCTTYYLFVAEIIYESYIYDTYFLFSWLGMNHSFCRYCCACECIKCNVRLISLSSRELPKCTGEIPCPVEHHFVGSTSSKMAVIHCK